MQRIAGLVFCAVLPAGAFGQALNIPWSGYAHDPQHTAVSANASQPLNNIHWCTPVDLNPPGGGTGELLIHYGSPIVTAAKTVLLPVKTGNTGGYEVMAFQGAANCGFSGWPFSGSNTPLYTLTSDYIQPGHDWIPPYGPVLAIRNRVYYPGAGGTVYYRDSVDTATGPSGQIAFYGNTLYSDSPATFNNTVMIDTPITTDRSGTIYFGYAVTGPNPAGLPVGGGIARIAITGAGNCVTTTSIGTTVGDGSISQIALNAAPALSNDQRTLYAAVVGNSGYLVSLNTTSLAVTGHVPLIDPLSGGPASVNGDSSATPMVGPDGDVYFGVLEQYFASHHDRGWLLHFNSTLTQSKLPGSFGWDNTPALVTSSLVPSYRGTSAYLILTKYNNYIQFGDGQNKLAVLDPNAPMPDEYSSGAVTVMQEVLTILGPTSNPNGGVDEWCINTAAIDPFSKSALVNSEDGTLYRWDFTTNTFTQKIKLTGGLAEAYTPTAIGVDGTVYAINDAVIFAVGN